MSDDEGRGRSESADGDGVVPFTDIEGSTLLWDRHPDAMREALAHHDEILRTAIAAYGEFVFFTAGDAFSAAFLTSDKAVALCLWTSSAECPPLRAEVGGRTPIRSGGSGRSPSP